MKPHALSGIDCSSPERIQAPAVSSPLDDGDRGTVLPQHAPLSESGILRCRTRHVVLTLSLVYGIQYAYEAPNPYTQISGGAHGMLMGLQRFALPSLKIALQSRQPP